VPLAIDGDRRAWDAVIRAKTWAIGVEAETVLDDLQAVERRINLKRRDGRLPHVVLLVADTRRNRLALGSSPAAFPDFAREVRGLLRALAEGRNPGRDGLVVL
jgi:predicted amidohydrolase YtcJ